MRASRWKHWLTGVGRRTRRCPPAPRVARRRQSRPGPIEVGLSSLGPSHSTIQTSRQASQRRKVAPDPLLSTRPASSLCVSLPCPLTTRFNEALISSLARGDASRASLGSLPPRPAALLLPTSALRLQDAPDRNTDQQSPPHRIKHRSQVRPPSRLAQLRAIPMMRAFPRLTEPASPPVLQLTLRQHRTTASSSLRSSSQASWFLPSHVLPRWPTDTAIRRSISPRRPCERRTAAPALTAVSVLTRRRPRAPISSSRLRRRFPRQTTTRT